MAKSAAIAKPADPAILDNAEDKQVADDIAQAFALDDEDEPEKEAPTPEPEPEPEPTAAEASPPETDDPLSVIRKEIEMERLEWARERQKLAEQLASLESKTTESSVAAERKELERTVQGYKALVAQAIEEQDFAKAMTYQTALMDARDALREKQISVTKPSPAQVAPTNDMAQEWRTFQRVNNLYNPGEIALLQEAERKVLTEPEWQKKDPWHISSEALRRVRESKSPAKSTPKPLYKAAPVESGQHAATPVKQVKLTQEQRQMAKALKLSEAEAREYFDALRR